MSDISKINNHLSINDLIVESCSSTIKDTKNSFIEWSPGILKSLIQKYFQTCHIRSGGEIPMR